MADFEKLVDAARVFLLLRAPFFSHLIHGCEIVVSEQTETADINARGRMRLSPDFFAALAPNQRAFILAHEVGHPAFGYFWRSKGHHPLLANIAHDYVINALLREYDATWLPPEALYDPRFDGMAYEQVYATIKSELPVRSDGRRELGDQGSGGIVDVDGVVSSSGGMDVVWDESAQDAGGRMNWETAVIRAAEAARASGRFPDGIARAVDGLLDAKIPWENVLSVAVCEALHKTRDNWNVPHRRSEMLDFYLPSETFLGFDVSICVDSSGSISGEMIERAVAEIEYIVRHSGGDGRFVVGDAAVHGEVALADFSPSMMRGGGGTSFVPHFEYLEQFPPRLCVFFTDTFGEFPDVEPDFPVIWAVYRDALNNGASVPFGEIVAVDL